MKVDHDMFSKAHLESPLLVVPSHPAHTVSRLLFSFQAMGLVLMSPGRQEQC